jgi:hypothetical protein
MRQTRINRSPPVVINRKSKPEERQMAKLTQTIDSASFQPSSERASDEQRQEFARVDAKAFLCNADPSIVVYYVKVNNGPWQNLGSIGLTCDLPDMDECLALERYVFLTWLPAGQQVQVSIQFKKNGGKFCPAVTPVFTAPTPPDVWVGTIANGALQQC